jgi:hypothetical protein
LTAKLKQSIKMSRNLNRKIGEAKTEDYYYNHISPNEISGGSNGGINSGINGFARQNSIMNGGTITNTLVHSAVVGAS